jgi:hypothetical protein
VFVITFTINTVGAIPIILGDDPNKVWVNNFSPDGGTQEQIGRGLRWAQVVPYDRGNFMSTISWISSRKFTDYGSCVSFIAKHRQSLAGIGTLLVTISGATTLTLAKAKVTCGKPQWNGIHAFIEYTAKGGLIT